MKNPGTCRITSDSQLSSAYKWRFSRLSFVSFARTFVFADARYLETSLYEAEIVGFNDTSSLFLAVICLQM